MKQIVRGILPVNAHVEVNILNLNYIYSFYFILLTTDFQMIYTTRVVIKINGHRDKRSSKLFKSKWCKQQNHTN